MSNIGFKKFDDTAAGCRARAASDRASADAAETINAKRKFDLSASRWEERASFLGRMDASFAKREKLDAARKTFNGVGSGKRLGEGSLIGKTPKIGSVRSWAREAGSVLPLPATGGGGHS